MLKSDFARYNLADDDADELDQDDYGWKIISTDVFRFPPHKSLLCAVLGENPGGVNGGVEYAIEVYFECL